MITSTFVSFAFAISFLQLQDFASAARVRIEGRPKTNSGPSRRAGLGRRVSGEGLSDRNDLSYFANITIGGVTVESNVDTGSSDLWIDLPVLNSQDLGVSAEIRYAIGAVQGNLHQAELDFAGYTVPNQTYLQAKPTDANTGSNLHSLVGLGPDFSSNTYNLLDGDTTDQGDTVLGSIFKQNPNTPNFISFTLNRADDNPNGPVAKAPGELTIGELVPGLEAVTQQPKLPIPDNANKAGQHYTALMDGVKVRGQAVVLPATTVNGITPGKTVAVFDSGFSLPQVPKAITDAMYSTIPGAKFGPVPQLGGQPGWIMDCDQEVTGVSFTFGGVDIPIHPLDITAPLSFLTDTKSDKGCLGLWQPIGGPGSGNLPDGFDILLGAAFLRNVYMVVNVGDFVEGFTNQTADPFIQLLPLTNDIGRVHAEFMNARTSLKNLHLSGGLSVSASRGMASVILVAASSVLVLFV